MWRKDVGKSVFYAVIWSIWLERNHIIFRNKVCEGMLVDNIKTRIALWLKACSLILLPPSLPLIFSSLIW
ncbi:hypothetical protein RHGRI_014709 [Rhododendron griersonianum]|uniref:Uncharacterized protein n=1 Tax=Rhododendron griersonianum TaxID=479676 RepID=A0AAV6KAT6_9ERIC|nr:hypothetical protein RHGRI_014709 [Rhododendron griersonianum]